jgi:L-seryl-tRNA(Ser) seleniumtransferase
MRPMTEPIPTALLRELPSVDQVLRAPEAAPLLDRYGRAVTANAIRDVLAEARQAILKGGTHVPDMADIEDRTSERLSRGAASALRPLFNLTGTVLHTNMGRALLAEAAVTAATDAMRHALAIEYDLTSGKRGERDDHVRDLLCELTGAEDATVVNNNAASVLIVLNTFGLGRETIVSRGELIEIGGSFRMPEIMARAGTELVEVGTTNRTHLRDYEAALGPRTGLILKVHTSNYRIEGFTAEAKVPALAELAGSRSVPLVNDLGSGTLIDLVAFGLPREKTVRDAIDEGANLVTFSGDKLLGGPQAGFIVGRQSLIARINKNPMKRALRVDKIRLAALEATLKLYRDPERLSKTLPTMRLIGRALSDIEAQARRIAPHVAQHLGQFFDVAVIACRSQIGSGALPVETLPSTGLAIRPVDGSGTRLNALSSALRGLAKPVIGRVEDGALVLDLRCLDDEAGFVAMLASLDQMIV